MVDTGRTVGTATPVHPITGETRQGQENIVAFARRHGWTVEEVKGPDDYYTEVFFAKDGRSVTLSLWPGRNREVALARTSNGVCTMPIRLHGKELRTRVESFLAGVLCICEDKQHFFYENKPKPDCQVHGVGE
jgi:hypothetical protein